VVLAHTVDHIGSEITIVLVGEADLANADQLRQVLFDAVAQLPMRITVDLRGLVFIDSSGIAVLVAARRAAMEHQCTFRVTKPQGPVLRVLTVAGVLAALTQANSSGEAVGGAQPCA
jgi:anti-anti-sigma factor